jgi:hypothetical protein
MVEEAVYAELVPILVQMGGAPAAIGFIFWLFWVNGLKPYLTRVTTEMKSELHQVRVSVEKDMAMLSNTIQEVRSEMTAQRDMMQAQVIEHRVNQQRLDALEREARAKVNLRYRNVDTGHKEG